MINIHVSNYIEKIIFNEKKKEKKKKKRRKGRKRFHLTAALIKIHRVVGGIKIREKNS